MSYAEGTQVAVSKTREEIHSLLEKRRAQRIALASEAGRAIVFFQIDGKAVQFSMPLPSIDEKRFVYQRNGWSKRADEARHQVWEQACREKWRGLLLTLKAKFVSVDNGVETLEEAFLAHLALPGGGTVGQRVLPEVANAYEKNEPPRFLLGPG